MLRLSATSEYRLEVGVFEGQFGPKFQVERGSLPPAIHLVGQLDVIRMRAELSFVLSQFTRLADGQTEGSLITIPRLCGCSTVKTTTSQAT